MKILPFLIISFLPILLNGQQNNNRDSKTAGEIIEQTIKRTGIQEISNTVDVIVEGDSATPVSGIVTCMVTTMDVLKQAVEKNCNLIVTHEPVYYNHVDNTKHLAGDSVFITKKQFIKENQLVIWRFHDYIHSIKPDAILTGVVRKLGWQDYIVDGQNHKFSFPEMTLKELLKKLKNTFPEVAFHVVGEPEMKLKNVQFIPGAAGGEFHIRILGNADIDVLIAGEAPQWETYEYVRDAIAQGQNKAVVFIGHINSEESGMQYCAEWMSEFIVDIPVFYLKSGLSYWSY